MYLNLKKMTHILRERESDKQNVGLNGFEFYDVFKDIATYFILIEPDCDLNDCVQSDWLHWNDWWDLKYYKIINGGEIVTLW